MAEKFGARKSDKYILVSSAPSVNKTPMGPSVVPVPYPVTQELDLADAASKDVDLSTPHHIKNKKTLSKYLN